MNKIPVDVEVEVRRDGEQIPKAIIWSDGRRFTISRVVYDNEYLCGCHERFEEEGNRCVQQVYYEAGGC